ncbi:MAG: carboxypeptidase-like regulatory domain-containing protein [Bacteroidetes bacterium]|nr:carboxypeptidase-like regulatory domain-containing protein [Bacteroidota bacterium]
MTLLVVVNNPTFSQKDNSDRLIQLSGVVVTDGEVEPLPYTTIFDKTIRKGVIADYYGFFSLVTKPGDTLFFSYYGHKTSSFIVPDTLTSNRYSIIHVMQKDTLNLPQVDVYPWPSREDFARAFVEMEPYDDALRRAQRQLSGESLAFAAARIETDASLASGYAMNQLQTKIYTQGQTPVNNLFNPYSWAKFIESWKKGELKRE